MAASLRPNQMMAAGTRATDGRPCRPDSTGASAARSGRSRATASPSGVATTTETTNPSTPRRRLVQTAPVMCPCCHWSARVRATSVGAGSTYAGFSCAQTASCQTASTDRPADQWQQGHITGAVWTSLLRGVLGFVVSVVVATPLGLAVARLRPAAGGARPGAVRPAGPAVGGLGAGGHHLVRPQRRGHLLCRAAGRRTVDHQWAGRRARPSATAAPPGRPGARRPRPDRGPLGAAAGGTAQLPRRAQAGLGLRLALANGGGADHLLAEAGPRAGTAARHGSPALRHEPGGHRHSRDLLRR